MSYVFLPDSGLTAGRSYSWQIRSEFAYTPASASPADSLYSGKLQSVPGDSLGSIRIEQQGTAPLHCTVQGAGIERQVLLEPGMPLVIGELPAGRYHLLAYIDENGDGRYNSGGLGPMAAAETFFIYPDRIRVRARWETDLGIWLPE